MSTLRRAADNGGRALVWLIVPCVAVVAWQSLYMVVGQPALASPADTVSMLTENLPRWSGDLRTTVTALLVSFVISVVLGVLLGFLVGLSRFWYGVISPLLLTANAIPKIVLYPIVLSALGVTMPARVTFAVLHGIFPIMVLTSAATTTVPEIYVRVARSFSMSPLGRLRYVVLPAITPSVIASLRIGFGSCFLGLVVAEMFAAYDGIGFRLSTYVSGADTTRLCAIVLLTVLVAFALTGTIYALEERRARRLGQRTRYTL
jgi:NitT/TauT family transport system permease protein